MRAAGPPGSAVGREAVEEERRASGRLRRDVDLTAVLRTVVRAGSAVGVAVCAVAVCWLLVALTEAKQGFDVTWMLTAGLGRGALGDLASWLFAGAVVVIGGGGVGGLGGKLLRRQNRLEHLLGAVLPARGEGARAEHDALVEGLAASTAAAQEARAEAAEARAESAALRAALAGWAGAAVRDLDAATTPAAPAGAGAGGGSEWQATPGVGATVLPPRHGRRAGPPEPAPADEAPAEVAAEVGQRVLPPLPQPPAGVTASLVAVPGLPGLPGQGPAPAAEAYRPPRAMPWDEIVTGQRAAPGGRA